MDCSLVTELKQMKEIITQLEAHLSHHSSIDLCKDLASKMHFSVERSINIAKSFNVNLSSSESPFSVCSSPQSENSERDLKYQDGRETSKKRKTLPKLRKQVTVNSECGIVGPLEDGHSWRKYGQKDILGAKYPRGYYRCTHRNTQGCLATKQVQRTDENPMIFDVTYNGTHTCFPKSNKPNFNSLAFKKEQDLNEQKLIQPIRNELKFEMEGDFDSSFNQFSISSSHNLFGEFGDQLCEFDRFDDLNQLISMADMDFNLDEFETNFATDASNFFS